MFFLLGRGGGKLIKEFSKMIKLKKKKKNGHFSFFGHFAITVPHTVISNSEKLTHPSVQVCCTFSQSAQPLLNHI